jgi:hypothetical protein
MFVNINIECIRNSNNRCKRYYSLKLKYRNSNWHLEAFRRLQNFQTQAIALDLARFLNEMDPTNLYDTDLWPGVTNLIVSEMAKRSWTMFKLYLSKAALELGRSSNFDTMEIQVPTLVDDEVGNLISSYLANRD